MILVTKEEAMAIRSETSARVTTTSRAKNSRQKKHYAEEHPDVFKILRRFRQSAESK